MWNNISVKVTLIFMHVSSYFIHGEFDGVLDFFEVLYFLDLIVRELVFGGAKNAFVSKELLALLFGDYLFR